MSQILERFFMWSSGFWIWRILNINNFLNISIAKGKGIFFCLFHLHNKSKWKKEKEKKNMKITSLEHIITDFCLRCVPIQAKNITMKTSIDIHVLKTFFLSKVSSSNSLLQCYISQGYHRYWISIHFDIKLSCRTNVADPFPS